MRVHDGHQNEVNSPNHHEKVRVDDGNHGSLDVVPSKVKEVNTVPVSGVTVKCAVGAWISSAGNVVSSSGFDGELVQLTINNNGNNHLKYSLVANPGTVITD